MRVISPGISDAVRNYATKRGLSLNKLGREIEVDAKVIHKLVDREGDWCGDKLFDAVAAVITAPWTRPWCDLEEMPNHLKELQLYSRRDYSFRRVSTPHLDAFNGMPGGWC